MSKTRKFLDEKLFFALMCNCKLKFYSAIDTLNFSAAATLLQQDGLIDQCCQIMEETINIETVVKYYETAQIYGCGQVQNSCLNWLKVNLLSHLPEHPEKLRQVPIGNY